MTDMNKIRSAKYTIGQVVRHRVYPFRGVVFDIDPLFSNTEEWYQSIPSEVRPHKDQPYYHLFAENVKPNTSPMSPSKTCCRTIPASRSGIPRSPRFSTVTTKAAIGRAIRC